jgi:hypothetical protein
MEVINRYEFNNIESMNDIKQVLKAMEQYSDKKFGFGLFVQRSHRARMTSDFDFLEINAENNEILDFYKADSEAFNVIFSVDCYYITKITIYVNNNNCVFKVFLQE